MGSMAETGPRCDVCGEALPDGAYFCGECGSRVPHGAVTHRTEVPTPHVDVSVPPREHVTEGKTERVTDQATDSEAGTHAGVGREPEPEPQPEPQPGAVPPVTYMLEFSTGERAQIVGYGRIGRRPTPPADAVPDHLIVVSDETKTVSKNHLDVWATSAGLEIADLGSANGTVVSMPGIAAEAVMPGQRVRVLRGTRVTLGDQSFTVA